MFKGLWNNDTRHLYCTLVPQSQATGADQQNLRVELLDLSRQRVGAFITLAKHNHSTWHKDANSSKDRRLYSCCFASIHSIYSTTVDAPVDSIIAQLKNGDVPIACLNFLMHKHDALHEDCRFSRKGWSWYPTR